jgi:archaellum component FlaC
MAEPTNIADMTYELLKRMSGRFERFEHEMVDVKLRLSSMDDHIAGLTTSVAGVHSRMDRLDERVGRIERRLDLVDAH